MHNPTNTAISFVLLVAVVGAAFSYVSGNPVEIVEPWLGIAGTIITPELAGSLNMAQNEGFLVTCVEPEGPAANGGLKERDIITEVDHNQVQTRNDIAEVLAQKQIGESIDYRFVRGTEPEKGVTLTLVDKPDTITCKT